jgi:hypothetical protein
MQPNPTESEERRNFTSDDHGEPLLTQLHPHLQSKNNPPTPPPSTHAQTHDDQQPTHNQ